MEYLVSGENIQGDIIAETIKPDLESAKNAKRELIFDCDVVVIYEINSSGKKTPFSRSVTHKGQNEIDRLSQRRGKL